MPLASCYVSLWDKDGCGHLRAHLPVAGKPQPQGKTPGEPFPGATTSRPLQRIGRRGGRPGSLANSGDWGNLRQQRQPACQRDAEQDRRLRRGSQWRRRPAPAPHRDPQDMSPAIRADEVGTVEEGPLSAVLAALARDDPAGVVAALDGRRPHGGPGSPAALGQQAGERLATALAPQKGRVTRWIDALATSPSPTGRQVACLLLASRYPEDPVGVLRTAEMLADDPHWEVREAAGGLLGTLLDRDFAKIRGRLEVLRSSRAENLRRSVVLAVKYAARRDKPERVPQLLAPLQPPLRDEGAYVRRHPRPAPVGDGLLRVDPKEALEALREWARDRDQIVRWNVAMAFSSAIGSFHWPAAKSILERLAKGPEPLVRNAVAKAMRRSRQRYTEEVEETRLRWLQDRDRAATAELVGAPKKR